MNRGQLAEHISLQYGVEPEHPWPRFPSYEVFRHKGKRTWFAVVMAVPRERLGLAGAGEADILNVKVRPADVLALREQPGILPAYHMNKEHWLSVLLDGSVPSDQICDLLAESRRLTG